MKKCDNVQGVQLVSRTYANSHPSKSDTTITTSTLTLASYPSVLFLHLFWKRTSAEKSQGFVGRMPFLSPNQMHQSTERNPLNNGTVMEIIDISTTSP